MILRIASARAVEFTSATRLPSLSFNHHSITEPRSRSDRATLGTTQPTTHHSITEPRSGSDRSHWTPDNHRSTLNYRAVATGSSCAIITLRQNLFSRELS